MGTLALPAVLSRLSFFAGVIILILAGFLGYWSLYILVKTTDKLKSESYSESVVKSFGPYFSKVLDVTIILYLFGTMIGYVIVSIYNYLTFSGAFTRIKCMGAV